MFDVTAGVDASGNITALDWTTYGQGGTTLMPTSEQVGFATWPATPPAAVRPRPTRPYKVAAANKRVLAKTRAAVQAVVKSTALRAPNAPQRTFAAEQLIDELAVAANMDPVAFRKLNVDPAQTGAVGPVGQRWLALAHRGRVDVELAAEGVRLARSSRRATVRKGRGIASARSATRRSRASPTSR